MQNVNLLAMMFAAPEVANNQSSSQQVHADPGFQLMLQQQLWSDAGQPFVMGVMAAGASEMQQPAAAGESTFIAGATVAGTAEPVSVTASDLLAMLIASLRQVLESGAVPAGGSSDSAPAGTEGVTARTAVDTAAGPVSAQLSLEPALDSAAGLSNGQQLLIQWDEVLAQLNAMLQEFTGGGSMAAGSTPTLTISPAVVPAVPWSDSVVSIPPAVEGTVVEMPPAFADPGLVLTSESHSATPASIRWFENAGIISAKPAAVPVASGSDARLIQVAMVLADDTPAVLSMQSRTQPGAGGEQVFTVALQTSGAEPEVLSATLTVSRVNPDAAVFMPQAVPVDSALWQKFAPNRAVIADSTPAWPVDTGIPVVRPGSAGTVQAVPVAAIPDGEAVAYSDPATSVSAVPAGVAAFDVISGETIQLQGEAVELQGEAVELQGEAVELQGKAVELQGKAVELQGEAVELQAEAVAVRNQTETAVRQPDAGQAHVQPVSVPVEPVRLQRNDLSQPVSETRAVPSYQPVTADTTRATAVLNLSAEPVAATVPVDGRAPTFTGTEPGLEDVFTALSGSRDSAQSMLPGESDSPAIQRLETATVTVVSGVETGGQAIPAGVADAVPAQLMQFTGVIPENLPQTGLQYLEMAERVMEQVNLVRSGSGGFYQARLNLNPPNLGEMFVNISVRGDAVALQLCVVSTVPRELLKDSLDSLRQSLEDAGLNVTELRVEQINPDEGEANDQSGRREPHDGSGNESTEALIRKAASPVTAGTSAAPTVARAVPALGFSN